ncbi:MAG TPA: GNAT family N-acetyltransferase [Burkholderiaceae bacterium]|nr:GNAT family N-acetyltransferase [Burkholderiaceae bacterium]
MGNLLSAAARLPQRLRPLALQDRFHLADGRQVLLRPIEPQDAEAEQAFVRRLSLASRQRRFHIGIRELAPQMLREFTEVDQRRHVAIVAQVCGPHAPLLVADARYVRNDDDADAEFAIAVADDWQGQGLGTRLLHRLARLACHAGVHRLYGEVLHGNEPMIAMLRREGARLATLPGDARLVLATIDPALLAASTP